MVEFIVEFDLEQEDGIAYGDFIEGLRNRLQHGTAHQLPVLRPQQDSPSRWFEVVLRRGSDAVRLRIRLDNLYLNGFRSENSTRWFEFNNRSSTATHLIPGSTFLGFEGSYVALERAAYGRRESINLGQQQLVTAVNRLATPDQTESREKARSLMVVIQMICEAIRFRRICEWLVDSFTLGGRPTSPIIALENGWADLSAALLRVRAEQDPGTSLESQLGRSSAMQINTIAQAIAAIGILLHYTIPGPSRRPRSVAFDTPYRYPIGRPLVEVFWVRIDNIDNEDPGDLYGTIVATDGLSSQYLYNRNTADYESIHAGEHALLSGPPRVISAAGCFVISLSLWDYDLVHDDEIVRGEIKWNVYDFSNKYDNPHNEVIGIQNSAAAISIQNGAAAVSYVVMSNAAEALIELILIDGDGENPAEVYGHITADTAAGNLFGAIELFRKGKKDYVKVRRQQAIPLSRQAVAVPMDGSLVINADLWDHDAISFEDQIAAGRAEFYPQINVSRARTINGRNGRIEVRVSWH